MLDCDLLERGSVEARVGPTQYNRVRAGGEIRKHRRRGVAVTSPDVIEAERPTATLLVRAAFRGIHSAGVYMLMVCRTTLPCARVRVFATVPMTQ